MYRGWLFFNTTNTTLGSQSYPYNTLNLTIDLNLTDRLNATMVKVITDYANPVRIQNTSKINNLTLEITVRPLNGSLVSTSGVMDVGDFYSASITEANTSKRYLLTSLGKANPAAALCDTDTCNIRGIVPANVVGGRYTALINVRWNASEANLTGTGENTSIIINNTGINMSNAVTKVLGSMNELTSKYFNVTVGNLGPLSAIGMEVTFNKGACPVTITRETSKAFSSGCSVTAGTSGATHTMTINAFTPIEGGCALRWKLTGINVSTDVSCNINVTANRASFTNITGITLTVVDTGTTTTSSSGGGGSSTSTSCSSNSGCASNEYCSTANVCTTLDCDSHEYISDQACVAYAPTVTQHEQNIYLLFGSSNSTTITVSEENNRTVNTALNIDISSDISTNVSPASCTAPCDFNITFTSKNTSEIKVYNGTYKPYATFASAATTSTTFSVTVLPTAEKKAEIESSYAEYLALMASVKAEFDSLKATGAIAGGNLTILESLLGNMNNISVSIQAALDSGNYIQANTLLTDLNSTITQIQSKLSDVEGITFAWPTDLLFWAVVGIVIVGVGAFVVYLLLPPRDSGFRAGRTFAPKKPGVFSRVKRSGSAKKKSHKISKYVEGYAKYKPFVYKKKSKNPLSGMLKKKKQRKVRDFSK